MKTEAGLRPLLVLFLAPFAGILVTLSLAPFDLWPLGIISCALYAYLLCTCSVREGVWRSWLFGLGMFGSGVSWVYVSIHDYGGAGPVLATFLIVLFCVGLSLLFLRAMLLGEPAARAELGDGAPGLLGPGDMMEAKGV